MRNNTDYIHELMTQKLGEVISATDEHYLDELIENDPLVKEKWLAMQAIFHTPVSKVKPLYKLLLAAAIVTGICLTTLYVIKPSNPQEDNIVAANGIQLHLANGKQVDLSQPADSVTIGNAKMGNVNKTLVITSAEDLPTGINSIAVPVGETYKITLADGTLVWLNSASKMDFPFAFNSDKREISISGEAYLEVAQNTKQPFQVNIGNNQVQVLGTAFNVNTYDIDKIKISLVNGAVRFVTVSQQTTLQPDQQAILTNGEKLTVEAFDTERELSWRQGVYYFKDASLDEIARIIPRWFGNAVKLDSKTAGDEHFTGRMERSQPVTQLLESLKATTTIQYNMDSDGTIHIR